MFANCQLGGLNFGFPDACLTTEGEVTLTIPYPNFSTGMTANPATVCECVFMECMPAHNLMTSIPISMGDNIGLLGGVMSKTVMGPTKYELGSFTVFYEGMPATKLTSLTGQNGVSPNCPGMTIVPGQLTVLILT